MKVKIKQDLEGKNQLPLYVKIVFKMLLKSKSKYQHQVVTLTNKNKENKKAIR